jgi:hypothetical protein
VDAPAKMRNGNIEVTTHSQLSLQKERSFACDLLIVDEAHRAKGEGTQFAKALSSRVEAGVFGKVLVLTATPFSIDLDELKRMLKLLGVNADSGIDAFASARDRLEDPDDPQTAEEAADSLVEAASAAVAAMAPAVIRHSVDQLKKERGTFGPAPIGWDSKMTVAEDRDLELLIRADRAFDMTRRRRRGRRIEPSFHVGLRELGIRVEAAREKAPRREVDALPRQRHIDCCSRLLTEVLVHPKMSAAAADVRAVVDGENEEAREKVVIFCHHHVTAQELVGELVRAIPVQQAPAIPLAEWRKAWRTVLGGTSEDPRETLLLRKSFIDWLCAPTIRGQVAAWMGCVPRGGTQLAAALQKMNIRRAGRRAPTIADAARELFAGLIKAPEGQRVLRRMARGQLGALPGGGQARRVLALCERSQASHADVYFDGSSLLAMRVFNSAFGPDVLVVTDRYSEGIDLHRCCRYLLHYELDPSPIRIIQRNGRVRRVLGWSGRLNRPVQYAFPAFKGTRDEKLVAAIRQRLDCFDMLLGGIGRRIEVDEGGSTWRSEVTKLAARRLVRLNKQLTVA